MTRTTQIMAPPLATARLEARLAAIEDERAMALQADTEAREWLLDCASMFADDPDEYEDMVTLMSYEEVHAAVERYYDGGWDGFVGVMS